MSLNTIRERAVKPRTLAWIFTCALIALCLIAAWGCAPSKQSDSSGAPDQETPTAIAQLAGTGIEVNNFLDNNSGNFPDTYTNTTLLNAGNRGCNSCHDDLFDVAGNCDGFNHLITKTGYDKKLTVEDCVCCHRHAMQRTGPYLGDLMHAAHYSNEAFVEGNNNCWSCHVIQSDGDAKHEYDFLLWEEVADTPELGGMMDQSPKTRDWIASRAFDSRFITGVSLDAEPNVDIDFAQTPTDPEDVFVVDNWGAEVLDFDDVCSDEHGVTITGVKNPRTFTVEEIMAMPQVDSAGIVACGSNGHGRSIAANVAFTGVPLSYLVEQCGGLADGINTIYVCGADGWDYTENSANYLNGGFIATKYYGEELSRDFGYPLTLVCKGFSGNFWIKHITNIDFSVSDEPIGNSRLARFENSPESIYPINSCWFDNDGMTYKLGETISLKGATWSWPKIVGELEKISFSFDMGETWLEYNVDEIVDNFDPGQWVDYSVNWTPKEAGTYIVKVKGTDSNGYEPYKPISLTLVVEE